MMNEYQSKLYSAITYSQWQEGGALMARAVIELLARLPEKDQKEIVEKLLGDSGAR